MAIPCSQGMPVFSAGQIDLTIQKHERAREDLGLKRDFLDLTELIRSIQRSEGNVDCFRTARADCGEPDCAWRLYCLETAEPLPLNESWPDRDE